MGGFESPKGSLSSDEEENVPQDKKKKKKKKKNKKEKKDNVQEEEKQDKIVAKPKSDKDITNMKMFGGATSLMFAIKYHHTNVTLEVFPEILKNSMRGIVQ